MRCIVLAAGASARLGQPKALVDVGGKPLVQHLVERLENSGLEPVIVTRAEPVSYTHLTLPTSDLV